MSEQEVREPAEHGFQHPEERPSLAAGPDGVFGRGQVYVPYKVSGSGKDSPFLKEFHLAFRNAIQRPAALGLRRRD